MKLNHTVKIVVNNDNGDEVKSWALFYLSIPMIFFMTAILMTISDVISSAYYWLTEWEPDLWPLLVMIPVPVGYTPG